MPWTATRDFAHPQVTDRPGLYLPRNAVMQRGAMPFAATSLHQATSTVLAAVRECVRCVTQARFLHEKMWQVQPGHGGLAAKLVGGMNRASYKAVHSAMFVGMVCSPPLPSCPAPDCCTCGATFWGQHQITSLLLQQQADASASAAVSRLPSSVTAAQYWQDRICIGISTFGTCQSGTRHPCCNWYARAW